MAEEINDYELIKRAKQGDENAFQVLFGRYYMAAYKLAYKWVQNQQDAEDITQEAFVRIAKSIQGFRMDSAFQTWMFRIVINSCHDFNRGKSRQRKGMDQLQEQANVESHSSPVSSAVSSDLEATLNQLAPKSKDVFVLVVMEDLSHAEAAQILGCSEATVSWHIHWAKKKMRSLLQPKKAAV